MHNCICAIEADSGKYILPKFANKAASYKCPECKNVVIPRQGKIRTAHFAHKANVSTCSYFDRPGESQYHKIAKIAIMSLLQNNGSFTTYYRCKGYSKIPHIAYQHIKLLEGDEIILEYKSKDYIADIAIVNRGHVRTIIEIYHTHATTSFVRPEPWFELRTCDIFAALASDTKSAVIPCVRTRKKCYECNCYELKLGALDKHTLGYCLPAEDYSHIECICLECKHPVALSKNRFQHIGHSNCKMYNYPTVHNEIKDTLYKLTYILQTKPIKTLQHACDYYTWAYDDNEDYCDLMVEYPIHIDASDIFKLNFKEKCLKVCKSDNSLKYVFYVVAHYSEYPEKREENVFYVDMNDPFFPLKQIIYWKKCGSEEWDSLSICKFEDDNICNRCSKLQDNLSKLEKVDFLFDPQCKYTDNYIQKLQCVQCHKIEYNPVMYKGFRSICKDCVADLNESTLLPRFIGDE